MWSAGRRHTPAFCINSSLKGAKWVIRFGLADFWTACLTERRGRRHMASLLSSKSIVLLFVQWRLHVIVVRFVSVLAWSRAFQRDTHWRSTCINSTSSTVLSWNVCVYVCSETCPVSIPVAPAVLTHIVLAFQSSSQHCCRGSHESVALEGWFSVQFFPNQLQGLAPETVLLSLTWLFNSRHRHTATCSAVLPW